MLSMRSARLTTSNSNTWSLGDCRGALRDALSLAWRRLGAVSIHSADPAADARHLCRIQAALDAGCSTVAAWTVPHWGKTVGRQGTAIKSQR